MIDLFKYQLFVNRGNWVEDGRESILLGLVGLQGEVGEVAEPLKKHIFHGKPLPDKAAMVSEIGDVLWYLTLIANQMGISLEQVILANVAKLYERYPEQHEGFERP